MSLPLETVDYLKAWMVSPEHISHPYPSEQEKAESLESNLRVSRSASIKVCVLSFKRRYTDCVARLRGVEIQSQLLASYPKEDEDGDITQ
eukprot:scaffold2265_cov119-Alexandrium_tamarense.AAC.2